MKKNPIILLALSAICAGCTAVGPASSSSSSSSKGDDSSSVASSSDEVVSSDDVTSEVVSSDDATTEDSSEDSSETPTVTIDDIVAAAAKADITKIAGGKLTTTSESEWSDEGGDVTVSDYDYGTGVFHMTGSDWSGDYDLYLVYDTDGSIVAIKRNSENELSRDTVTYEIASLPFMNYLGYGTTAYGAEGLVQALAYTAKTDPNNDLKTSYSNDTYNFSFGCPYSSWYYYTVNVSFVIDDGAMTNAGVEIVKYGSDAFVTDDENGTTSLVEDASFEERTLYTVEQTVGERTFTSPYNLDDFAATSYTLTDANDVPLDDIFTMESGDFTKLKMTSVLPATTNFAFDTPKITVTGGTGLSVTFGSYDGPTLYFDASETGNYTVEIKTRKVTKTLNVVVEAPKPTSVSLAYYSASPSGYNWAEITDKSLKAYVGVNYYLAPTVSPYSANQSLNVTVDGEEGGYTLTETGIYLYSGSTTPVNTYAFNATKAGTYSVSFTSAVDDTIGYTVIITVSETPSFKDVLGEDCGFAYRDGGQVKYTFSFGFDDETGANGSVSIKDVQNDKTESATYSIVKSDATGMYNFELTHDSGDDLISSFELALAPDFTPYISIVYGEYTSTYALSVASSKFFLVQNWKGVSGDMTFTARFWDNGTVDLKMADSDMFANYYYCARYTVDDTPSTDGYVVTISTGDEQQSDSPFFALPATFYLSSDYQSLSVAFTCTRDSVDYSFSLAYASAGRGD